MIYDPLVTTDVLIILYHLSYYLKLFSKSLLKGNNPGAGRVWWQLPPIWTPALLRPAFVFLCSGIFVQ